MNPQLQQWRQRAEDNQQLAHRLVADMSNEQLGWTPEPRRWSTIQVLEHINGAAMQYHRLLRDAIARSRQHGLRDDGGFRPGWFQAWFIRQVEPQTGKRPLPAPRVFRPAQTAVDTSIRDQFFALGQDLQGILRDTEGVLLHKLRYSSPVTRIIRFNIGEGLWMLVAHEHRHLLQIQRLRAHPDFPSG